MVVVSLLCSFRGSPLGTLGLCRTEPIPNGGLSGTVTVCPGHDVAGSFSLLLSAVVQRPVQFRQAGEFFGQLLLLGEGLFYLDLGAASSRFTLASGVSLLISTVREVLP